MTGQTHDRTRGGEVGLDRRIGPAVATRASNWMYAPLRRHARYSIAVGYRHGWTLFQTRKPVSRSTFDIVVCATDRSAFGGGGAKSLQRAPP